MKCALEWEWDAPITLRQLLFQSWMSACSESFLSAADWSLWQPTVIKKRIISNVIEWGRTSIWLTMSPWRRRKLAYCGFEPSGGSASVTTRTLIRLVIWSTLWVGKRLFTACLATSPECIRWAWCRGVDLARFLSLPGPLAVARTSCGLYVSCTEWKVLCPGIQFCI